MKNVLIIFFIFITHFLSAQDGNNLTKWLQLMQKPAESRFQIDSTGFSELKNPIFYTKNGATDAFITDSENMHLIDFNNDGDKDIIYQDTEHHQAIILFANKGNDFVEIWSFPGTLVEINQEEETTIYVAMNAFGCIETSMLFELVVNNDNTLTESSIAYHNDTAITNIDTTFYQKKVSGVLRTQPVINDQRIIDPCTGDAKTGNQVRVIENKTVTVIKDHKDWLLVVYKQNETNIISWIIN